MKVLPVLPVLPVLTVLESAAAAYGTAFAWLYRWHKRGVYWVGWQGGALSNDHGVRSISDIGGRAAEEFEQLVATVVGFFEAPARGLDLPLDLRGTPFQRRVWQALREIPAGSTASYSGIAERIGAPKEAYAVAEACASNAVAAAIPCHGVVRKNGALSGYRWGFKRKRALLERERACAVAS